MRANFRPKLHFKKLGYESKNSYINKICTFDIEVSSFINDGKKQSIMYLYGIRLDTEFVIGRNWKDFLNDIKSLIEIYNINLNNKLVIYVHNLSYEFQFIRKLFSWNEVFLLDNRKVCKAVTLDGIEFRCSYILSNYKLEILARNIPGYNGSKQINDLDYKKIRHYYTKLSTKELRYLYFDTDIVYAYINSLISNDNLYFDTIPNTATSFVRISLNEFKLKFKDNKINRLKLETSDNYLLARQSFIGGFVHANYTKVNKKLYNVHSKDEASAYPWAIISEKYPMETPKEYIIKDKNDFIDKLNNYYCIFEIEFTNIKEKFKYDNYISKHKATYIDKYILNNGRVRFAHKLRMVITEIDFEIINKTYKWEKISIGKFIYGKKDFLPKYLILAVLKYYNDKTKLKDIPEKLPEYMHSKNNINSLYGAMVTDIIRDEIHYKDNEFYKNSPNIDEKIMLYDRKNKSLWYLWGLYVPAYNRRNVWQVILELGEDYVYTDTDSVKYINNHDNIFKKYNENILSRIDLISSIHDIPKKLFMPKTKQGKQKIIGIFADEGTYQIFKTLGAKRYIYVQDNELEITISGVSKEKGKKYLFNEYKTIDNIFEHFDSNLTFPATYICKEDGTDKEESGTGKMSLTYLDEVMYGYIIDYNGKECIYKEPSGIYMENASYNLSLEYSFLQLIKGGLQEI